MTPYPRAPRLRRLIPLLALALAGATTLAPGVTPGSLNFYDWTAVAPVVVVATVYGEEGKFIRVRVVRTLRGEVEEGTDILVDQKYANRTRHSTQPTLKLKEEAGQVVLLLERSSRSNARNKEAYLLARGVDGMRPLPAEGAEAIIEGLEALLRIQAIEDYDLQWEQLAILLDQSSNPVVIETILDEFYKFRRGDTELLYTLEVLVDHPRPPIRAKVALVAGVIAERLADEEPDTFLEVLPELMALARRDPSPEVRIAATSALGELPESLTMDVLEEIASEDPEQNVRYTAEKILYERRAQSGDPSGPDAGAD